MLEHLSPYFYFESSDLSPPLNQGCWVLAEAVNTLVVESPASLRTTRKKNRASDKFLMEIQIELNNQTHEFYPKESTSVHPNKAFNYIFREKDFHQMQ